MHSSPILRPSELRIPPGSEEPAFAEPWEAQAFAIVVALHDRGLFTWTEWAAALSVEVRSPGAAADGHDHYEHVLHALEALVTAKGIADTADVDALTAAWQRAAEATPHGKPILLENDPRGKID
jgi:nitrile hydratase accessory protein